jgi:hypothetical protein
MENNNMPIDKVRLNEIIGAGLSYNAYLLMVEDLLSKNQTTGKNQSEEYLAYTRLNQQRMKRLDKTIKLNEDIKNLASLKSKKQIWLMIAEAWCGDCAQNIPPIAQIAKSLEDRIKLVIVGRDDHEDLMNEFLTNGSRSIPKLIIMDAETLEVINSWGPRPKAAQSIVEWYKANKATVTLDEFETQLHGWYAKDKALSIQDEFLSFLK